MQTAFFHVRCLSPWKGRLGQCCVRMEKGRRGVGVTTVWQGAGKDGDSVVRVERRPGIG